MLSSSAKAAKRKKKALSRSIAEAAQDCGPAASIDIECSQYSKVPETLPGLPHRFSVPALGQSLFEIPVLVHAERVDLKQRDGEAHGIGT